MPPIQRFIKGLFKKKEDSEAYAREQQVRDEYERKKLSSNERELMRYKEEEREKRIKYELESRRKKENDDVWSGKKGQPLAAKNVVAGQKNLFRHGNMFKDVDNAYKHKDVVNCKNVVNCPNIIKKDRKWG